MFSLSALVGTPQAQSRLEFTPIGKRKAERKPKPVEEQRIGLNTEKVNNTFVESTFEDTTDRFDTLESFDMHKDAAETRERKAPGMFDSMFKRNGIINSGASLIQDLQDENKELKGENYNLKIEVATLTKFLKQTPLEHRNLAHENVELKQQLMKALDQVDAAKSTKRTLPVHIRDDSVVDSLKALYREVIEDKDHEIHMLQQQLSQLKHRAEEQPSVPKDVLDQVEFLRNENQSLRRQLGEVSLEIPEIGQLQRENSLLRTEIDDLRRKLSTLPSDAPSQLEQLTAENDLLSRKLRTNERDVKELEQEKDNLEAALRTARLNLAEKDSEIDRLSHERNDYKTRSKHVPQDDGRLDAVNHELNALQAKAKREAAHYSQELEEKAAEISRLNSNLSSLKKELTERDKEDFSLRSQIRSLMEERNAAFDNQTTIKHYTAQLENLREKEDSLLAENRRLKDEVAKAQDELYSAVSNSNNQSRLKGEIEELQDKLDYYEKEYSLLQDALESAESEAEMMKAKQRKSEDQIVALETDVGRLRSKLRRSELVESQKFNESALLELDELHRSREDAEKRRLELQIESLNLQIRNLERELSTSKSFEPAMLKTDYHDILTERSRLQMQLDDKELKLKEEHKRYVKLETVVKDKDMVIEALESRIRDFNNDLKSKLYGEESSRSEMNRVRSDYERQLRNLRLENDRLQRDLEEEIRYYKTRLDVFTERETHQPVQSGVSSSIVTLLESQLEDLRRSNKELMDKLDKAERSNLHNEAEEVKLRELQLKYDKVLDEKIRFQATIDELETDSKLLRAEKNRLEIRAKNLATELTKTSRHCTKLANKINDMDLNESKNSYKNVDEVLRAKKANIQLQNQIENLNARLAAADFSSSSSSDRHASTETRLLRNELRYYKAKLLDLSMRANDLGTMNSYLVSSLSNHNQVIKNDIVKLAQSGIYPNYLEASHDHKKKLTMKTLATFVLGMVRLRRRMEKAASRDTKLELLRGEIERDKITLMAER